MFLLHTLKKFNPVPELLSRGWGEGEERKEGGEGDGGAPPFPSSLIPLPPSLSALRHYSDLVDSSHWRDPECKMKDPMWCGVCVWCREVSGVVCGVTVWCGVWRGSVECYEVV